MPLVPDARVLYAQAFRERFAAPAFNVCNLEMAQGAVQAAEAEEAPIILQTYPGDLAHGGGALAPLLRALAAGSVVPVALHLDHGEDLGMAVGRLRQGYGSVMFDGSHLELAENIRETRKVAEVAHAFSASLEGELGLFGGDHGSVVFTDPEDAERFVAESEADTLAVSVGSEHHQQSRLDLGRLAEIAGRVNHPLVLHGGSGIHPDDVREAVSMGVVKINIGHAIAVAMNEGAREALDGGLDHYAMLALMREKVRERAADKIRLMGAAGRAAVRDATYAVDAETGN
jgi:fructose-bisphosphate aldolase class II